MPGRPCDLVLDGGGVRGAALVGAIDEIERRGWEPQRLLGSSAGAFVAVLHAAGYPTGDLVDLLADAPIDEVLDISMGSPRTALRRSTRLLRERGLRSGDGLEEWLRARLADKGVRGFDDLVLDPDEHNPRLRYAAQVVVSDLTLRRPRVLPAEARSLGHRPDELDVARIVRASAAVPLVLTPVDVVDPRTGTVHVLVDGGLLNTFPVDFFDAGPGSAWPTFGIDLHAEELERRQERRWPAPTTLPGFVLRLGVSLTGARDWNRGHPDTDARTVRIPLGHVSPVDTGADITDLVEIGRAAAKEFFATRPG